MCTSFRKDDVLTALSVAVVIWRDFRLPPQHIWDLSTGILRSIDW